MANYCGSCGKENPDGAAYCRYCGSAIVKRKIQSPGVRYDEKKTNKPSPKKAEKKGSFGVLKWVLAAFLIINLAVAGFWKPGFLLPKKKEPAQTTIASENQEEADSKKDEQTPAKERESGTAAELPDWPWISDPVDITPFEGLHITAEANALYEDTVLKVTPREEESEEIRSLNDALMEDGMFMAGLWEMDAGLSEGQVLPGEYHVDVDLEAMGIPESLYEDVRILRIDDNKVMTELNTSLSGKTLSYSSDSNSQIVTVIVGGAVIVGLLTGWAKSEVKTRDAYYYNDMGCVKGDTEWGNYEIAWKMSEVDPELDAKRQKLQEIESRLLTKAKNAYEEREKQKKNVFGALSFLFDENISVAERFKKLKETDGEYKKVSAEIAVPKHIQEVAKRVADAFEFLGNYEMAKMPKHRVRFNIRPKDNNNMGSVVQPKFIKSYVDIVVEKPEQLIGTNEEDIKFRDQMLLTITHELFHICQERYHLGAVTDSTRFDEMTAVVLESDAKYYYDAYDRISTDPETTKSTTYNSLIFPIDEYLPLYDTVNPVQYASLTKDLMQRQGYALSNFVLFLREKTGKKVFAESILRARSYFMAPETTRVLRTVFELTEAEFDIYFRQFCVKNRDEFCNSFKDDHDESVELLQNKEVLIEDNGKAVLEFHSYGSYAAGIRRTRTSLNPCAVMMKLSKEAKEKLVNTQISPVGKCEQISDGVWFDSKTRPQDGKNGVRDHYFLEIYGDIGSDPYIGQKMDVTQKAPSSHASITYTVYAVSAPDAPELSMNDRELIVRLPNPKGAAKDGMMDGLRITVKNKDQTVGERFAEKSQFGSEVRIPLSELNPKKEENFSPSVVIEEYVNSTGKEKKKLYGPPSDAAKLQGDLVWVLEKLVYDERSDNYDACGAIQSNRKCYDEYGKEAPCIVIANYCTEHTISCGATSCVIKNTSYLSSFPEEKEQSEYTLNLPPAILSDAELLDQWEKPFISGETWYTEYYENGAKKTEKIENRGEGRWKGSFKESFPAAAEGKLVLIRNPIHQISMVYRCVSEAEAAKIKTEHVGTAAYDFEAAGKS